MSKTPLALLVLFFFSGACSLVYQVVWVRMLMPVFGVSTFARQYCPSRLYGRSRLG